VVDAATVSIKNNGRLIYIGAGTSGRLGILDAAECRPTFSVPDGVVVGVIAGGETAIQHAVEGAEDDTEAGKNDLQQLALNEKDTVVGISASGRTPYVSGALKYASSIGCTTGAIACSPNAAIFEPADIAICPVVGPEVLTGSTRMKSGTAQKLILNMISTATMVKLGKTYENLMVDVNATNDKLKARALRIVMQATDCDESTAEAALNASNNSAKTAILMVLTGASAEQATKQLAENSGFLRKALNAGTNE
jgi:N-acetylmuramic acid 6-phosphate etherase